MHKIGMTELLVILVIALVIFGPKALPKLGESIGKTISSFKRGIKDSGEEEDKASSTAKSEKNDAQ